MIKSEALAELWDAEVREMEMSYYTDKSNAKHWQEVYKLVFDKDVSIKHENVDGQDKFWLIPA